MEYVFKYKCRLCDEIFDDVVTGSEDVAFKCTLCAANNKPVGQPQAPHLVSVHISKTHFGIADLIGCDFIET